jgi:hypothetical protein
MAMSRSLGSSSLTTRSPIATSPPVMRSSPAPCAAGGLAAARGADDDDELAVGDLHVDAVDDRDLVS